MLEIRGISKTFHAGTLNEVRALRNVSVTIEEGSFVIVIGTNGSGKSSLLNAVAGTFFIDSGSLRLAGRDVTRWPEHRRAQLIGRVFQNPFSGTSRKYDDRRESGAGRSPWPNTRNGVVLGGGGGVPRPGLARLNLGLEDRLDNAIGSLSGGQRQALTLLMATWLKPQLLLLDEHTAALDPKSADQVIAPSEQIIEQERLTTLMVTHSMQQAAYLGDRLVMMYRGRAIY